MHLGGDGAAKRGGWRPLLILYSDLDTQGNLNEIREKSENLFF
jgi:hypothetical protein